MNKYNITFIGNCEIGKTSLLMTYNDKKIPEKYIPSLSEPFTKNFKIENKEFEIQFWDSGNTSDIDRIRYICINQSQLIAICFAIDNLYYSFESVENRYKNEVKGCAPKNSKIILIGTKIDLRNNEERINELKEENKKFVTKEEGIEMAKKIKAIKYFECSSFNQKGIETIFNEIALICFENFEKYKN
ncbi:ras-related c3 botulinum toxin substrate 1 [Anaeramoeba ignava]|uniref:Ras-related c3 botulinum toxin substrate 1 n=1 Tax=Anaeramoeba ignava TaxID=1746090 RepID=A0A9Q0LSA8_ANAIG|nr:ras-related c3 botulinum toxin substrate 1 [Anaeramoeba ignava]